MANRVDLFDSTYGHFDEQVLDDIRKETFGQDIGQNSWLTVDEFDRFISWLELKPGSHVLEIACGSGGPARYLATRTGARVTGIDANEHGVALASRKSAESGDAKLAFEVADANAPLRFETGTFDGLECIDSMNHLLDRQAVFTEWRRVLKPGGRAVFTDPVVITGPVTNDELALRSLVGLFLFTPPGSNERMIGQAGLRLLKQEDVTGNADMIARRWHDARARHSEALVRMEGEERFAGLQRFFWTVHVLTSERRLSRIAYLAEKPAGDPA